jgi:hypothetical protein
MLRTAQSAMAVDGEAEALVLAVVVRPPKGERVRHDAVHGSM